MHRNRVLAQVAVGCLLLFVALLVAAHLLAPGLGPVDHMVSEYANAAGPAGPLATAALLAWSLSLLAAALAAVWTDAPAGRAGGRRALAGCLLAAAAGLALAATCPTQAVRGVVPPGVARTSAGRLHDLGGGIAQLALFAAVVAGLHAVSWSRRLRGLSAILVALALLLGPLLTAFDAGARGLRQRSLVTIACAWELGLVATLARSERARR